MRAHTNIINDEDPTGRVNAIRRKWTTNLTEQRQHVDIVAENTNLISVLGLVVGSEREMLFVFSEEDGVTYVCLRCVVSPLSVVSPLARLWEIKGGWKKVKMARVEIYLRIRFYLQHGILGLFLVLQDSWRGYAYWDEIELWDVEKVEMAACVVGRVMDCALEPPCSFVSGIWCREFALSPLRWPRGELRTSVSRGGLRVRST